MILNAASLALLLLVSLSGVEALVLTQEKAMSVKLTESIKISCRTDSSSSYALAWYQQKPGESPKFLLVDSTRASGLPSRFTYSGSGSQKYLDINGVQAEDGAVYYCACHNCGSGTLGGGTEVTFASPTPPSLLLLAPSQSTSSGSEVSVVCTARGFRPDGAVLTWEEDSTTMAGSEVHPGPSQRQADGTFIQSSILKLRPERWSSGHTYTCHLTHPALTSPLRESVSALALVRAMSEFMASLDSSGSGKTTNTQELDYIGYHRNKARPPGNGSSEERRQADPQVLTFLHSPPSSNSHHQFGPCPVIQGVGSAPAGHIRQALQGMLLGTQSR
ncbi:hypothetical protein NFI96_012239 [Prochilodus magdalenae]|nr:hypothetical protein NFI96_012239 [Prochilodus magdalenae]